MVSLVYVEGAIGQLACDRMAEHYSPLYQLLNSINRHRGKYMDTASDVSISKGPGDELQKQILSQLKESSHYVTCFQ